VARFFIGLVVGVLLGLGIIGPVAWCTTGIEDFAKDVVGGLIGLGALGLLVWAVVRPSPYVGRAGVITGALVSIGGVVLFFLSLAASAGGHFG
jgi:hypothetical protein